MIAPERCTHDNCTTLVRRTISGPRCGGLLFGTRDQAAHSCGRILCDAHMLGRGIFRCQPCHDRYKADRP